MALSHKVVFLIKPSRGKTEFRGKFRGENSRADTFSFTSSVDNRSMAWKSGARAYIFETAALCGHARYSE